MMLRVLLVGAGGHAKVVRDAIAALGWSVKAYVDSRTVEWLDCAQYESDDAGFGDQLADSVAIGVGGMTPQALEARCVLAKRYAAARKSGPAVVDPRAIVSASASISDLAQVLVGSIVNADAFIGETSIVNTRAVVEHDASVGAGAHIAPGALVLGGAKIGDYCMIGSGAIILPGTSVPARTLVPAGSVYPR
jgi:sugar O-acyltransferase (sialic acid O-acetyltransferase NeuD family)